jgi:hypothetical protein
MESTLAHMNIETQFKAPQNGDTQKGKSKIHDIECVSATPPWEVINPYIITKFGCSSVVPIQWIAEIHWIPTKAHFR